MMNETVMEILLKNGLVITVDGELRCEEDCIRRMNWHDADKGRYLYYDSSRYVEDYDSNVVELDGIEDTHFEHDGEWYDNESYGICECCGNVVDSNYLHESHDTEEWICEDCGTKCYECGDWYRYSTNMVRYGDDYICSDCYNDHYTTCQRCGDVIHTDDSYYVRNIGDYCEYCMDNYSYYCPECGDNVSDEDWDCDCECCCDCAGSKAPDGNFHYISYSAKPDPVFMGRINPKRGEPHNDMGVGFELEMTTVDGDRWKTGNNIADLVGDRCYYKEDGSITGGSYRNGIEVISHPMKYDYFMNEFPWEELCRIARYGKYVSHDYNPNPSCSCGFHLHFSREYFGDTWNRQVMNVSKLLMFFAWCWNDLVKASRRKEDMLHWTKPNLTVKGMTRIQLYKVAKKQASDRSFDHRKRYVAVNLTNHNTVEIRLCRGSLNPKALKAWADLMFAVVHNCCTLPATQIFTDPQRFLVGITQETREYLNSRNAFVPGTYPEIR